MDARERVLRTAYELFRRNGLNPVGIDRIVAEAGVAKTTLYRHFPSREDLILAVLELHHARWTEDWFEREVERRADTPAARLVAIFDAFDEWFRDATYEGCFFTNVLVELHDRGSAIRDVSAARLDRILALLEDYADHAGIRDSERVARQVQILMWGCMIAALDGRLEAAREARVLAQHLVEEALPRA